MLFLIRGLPSAGKSTFALRLAAFVLAADDYFMKDGEYHFDPSKLAAAHQDCQARALDALKVGRNVAVANTFTQRWEMEPYLAMARELEIPVTVVDLFDGGLSDKALTLRNAHGVPLEAIQAMRERYEHDWRNGDVRPPWERG